MSRCWLITDTHLGIKNSSNEWIDIQKSFFYDWFLPIVRDNYKEGDILIHLGDLFDSRQSINLRVLNMGVDLFEDLSKIFVSGIHIICGNHDIYAKSTNDVNSLKSLKWIPNVHIHENPHILSLKDKNLLLVPWFDDKKDESAFMMSQREIDYAFCHTDFVGMNFNKWTKIDHGIDLDSVRKIKKVFSGHIHYSQVKENVHLIGCPYQLNRSDAYNKKGVILLDLESEKEIFFENDFSPKFIRVKYKWILNRTDEEILEMMSNNFVDLLIEADDNPKDFIDSKTELISNSRRFTVQPLFTTDEGILIEGFDIADHKDFSFKDLLGRYVGSLNYDDKMKSRLLLGLEKIYDIAVGDGAL
jgi:DNA repair exonuclease SbcCD nuclease subunit